MVSSFLVFNSSPSAIRCFAQDERHLAKQRFGMGVMNELTTLSLAGWTSEVADLF
jgi:hypothetical protein